MGCTGSLEFRTPTVAFQGEVSLPHAHVLEKHSLKTPEELTHVFSRGLLFCVGSSRRCHKLLETLQGRKDRLALRYWPWKGLAIELWEVCLTEDVNVFMPLPVQKVVVVSLNREIDRADRFKYQLWAVTRQPVPSGALQKVTGAKGSWEVCWDDSWAASSDLPVSEHLRSFNLQCIPALHCNHS